MIDVSSAGPLMVAADLALTRGGRELFRDLSFEVRPGQLMQIERSNGAGKTSLLRILAGLSRYGIVALLSNLLTSDVIFRSDFEDSSLEQLLLGVGS